MLQYYVIIHNCWHAMKFTIFFALFWLVFQLVVDITIIWWHWITKHDTQTTWRIVSINVHMQEAGECASQLLGLWLKKGWAIIVHLWQIYVRLNTMKTLLTLYWEMLLLYNELSSYVRWKYMDKLEQVAQLWQRDRTTRALVLFTLLLKLCFDLTTGGL